MARLATLVKRIRRDNPATVLALAGDTLSPSVASTLLQGRHMIAGLNALGLDLATFGNHEFDFGPTVLAERMRESKFVWLSANVLDRSDGRPFGGAQREVMLTLAGVRVGVFGLTTAEVVKSSSPGPGVEVREPIAAAREVSHDLRQRGAQVIVAVTHLDMREDRAMAERADVDRDPGRPRARAADRRGGQDPHHQGRRGRALPGAGGPVARSRRPAARALVDVPRDRAPPGPRSRRRGGREIVRRAGESRAGRRGGASRRAAGGPAQSGPNAGDQSRRLHRRRLPGAHEDRRGADQRRRHPRRSHRAGRPAQPAGRGGGAALRQRRRVGRADGPSPAHRARAGPGATRSRGRRVLAGLRVDADARSVAAGGPAGGRRRGGRRAARRRSGAIRSRSWTTSPTAATGSPRSARPR